MLLTLAGLSACNMDLLNKDPLAFLTPEDKNAQPPSDEPDPIQEISNYQPQNGMLSTMGLNLEAYFAQNTDGRDERIKRLENVVVALHKDLKSLAPPVGKFVGMQAELEKHLDSYPLVAGAPIPVAVQPQNASQAPKPLMEQQVSTKTVKSVPAGNSAPPAKSMSGGVNVTGVRTGLHSDKVRLVLDVSAKTPFTVDLDNSENILIVELPSAGWSASTQKNFSGKMPVLQSYRTESTGNGSMMIVQLKQSSNVIYQKALNALSGPGQRIVIDLQK